MVHNCTHLSLEEVLKATDDVEKLSTSRTSIHLDQV